MVKLTTETSSKSSDSALSKIIVGVVIALVAGGSAPWWWCRVLSCPSPATPGPPPNAPNIGNNSTVGGPGDAQPVDPPTGCVMKGKVFDRNTQAPVAGAAIDFYTYKDATRIKESEMVQMNAAITAPDGSFTAYCRDIAADRFPLRIAVSRRGSNVKQSTIFMPVKVDRGDNRSDINLPAYFDE